MQNKFTRLKRDKSTAKTYESLLKGDGPFKSLTDVTSKDIFLLALAIGYSESFPLTIDDNDQFIKPESFGEVLLPLVHALAVVESDEGVAIMAKEQSDVYSYAESYANAGIHILASKYNGHEDTIIEEWQREIIKTIKKDKILERVDKLV